MTTIVHLFINYTHITYYLPYKLVTKKENLRHEKIYKWKSLNIFSLNTTLDITTISQ